ncbi:hypothetical protein QJS10_CPB12g01178 [Acorus calamus]|uniref:Uncharacterized protein n=1 Tax=Acorus calamus TaxID=4465 RepID=A0AAV9DLN0_ACOCL|nr:hypothetical protein QJS10_CPB12g01178 [Acorus calamus]
MTDPRAADSFENTSTVRSQSDEETETEEKEEPPMVEDEDDRDLNSFEDDRES